MSSERTEGLALEKAPTRQEYEQILAGVQENLDGEMRLQTRFVLVAIGELGLRAGEVAHITRGGPHDWIDFQNGEIVIPEWSPCDCGYCKQQAKQETESNDITIEESMRDRWKPKGDWAIRRVPFDYKDEIETLFKRFFELYDGWPRSRVAVNRRVKRALRNSAVNRDPNSVSPKTLRVTAAKYHADNGLNPRSLANLMGFSSDETALKFYSRNSLGIRREMHRIYQD